MEFWGKGRPEEGMIRAREPGRSRSKMKEVDKPGPKALRERALPKYVVFSFCGKGNAQNALF
jgi:hypothetical protein